MGHSSRLTIAICGFLLSVFPCRADVVANIQFGSASSSPPTQAQTGAAVVGSAGDQWNLITSFPGTTARALNNTAGGASGISMTSNTPGGSGIYRSATAFNTWSSTPYQNLMSSYTNPSNSSANKNTLTFTGLNTSTLYDIYVYTSSDVSGRQIAVDINGTQQTANASNASLTSFVLNTNYLRFSNMSFGSGTMTLQYWMAAPCSSAASPPPAGVAGCGGSAGAGRWWTPQPRSLRPTEFPVRHACKGCSSCCPGVVPAPVASCFFYRRMCYREELSLPH